MAEDDVAATLDELERKLKDLEEELGAVPRGAPADAGAVLSAPAPAPTLTPDASDEPAPSTAEPHAPPAPTPADLTPPAADPELDAPMGHAAPSSADAAQAAFARFREAVDRSAREVVEEHARLLEALRVATPSPGDPLAAPGDTPLDAVLLDGLVVVDAGPFPDITSLSDFEEALGRVAGVRELHVRSFDGARAVVEVTLGRPVALGGELRRATALTITTRRAGQGRLSVALEPPAGQDP